MISTDPDTNGATSAVMLSQSPDDLVRLYGWRSDQVDVALETVCVDFANTVMAASRALDTTQVAMRTGSAFGKRAIDSLDLAVKELAEARLLQHCARRLDTERLKLLADERLNRIHITDEGAA